MKNRWWGISLIVVACVTAAAGARANAPNGRFLVGADPSVSDPSGPGVAVVYDARTKLTWQQGVIGPFEAVSETLFDPVLECADLELETGSVGWRVPTLKELLTLVDYAGASRPETDALIDARYFPSTPSAPFFSATFTPARHNQCADFTRGWLSLCQGPIYLRCVR